MAKFIIEDFHRTELDQLDPQKVREIRRKVLWAGAKVPFSSMPVRMPARYSL